VDQRGPYATLIRYTNLQLADDTLQIIQGISRAALVGLQLVKQLLIVALRIIQLMAESLHCHHKDDGECDQISTVAGVQACRYLSAGSSVSPVAESASSPAGPEQQLLQWLSCEPLRVTSSVT